MSEYQFKQVENETYYKVHRNGVEQDWSVICKELNKIKNQAQEIERLKESYFIVSFFELHKDCAVVGLANNMNVNDIYLLMECESFMESIEAFAEDKNINFDNGEIKLRISSISHDSGQQTFPETGQWDYIPYWEFEIEQLKEGEG